VALVDVTEAGCDGSRPVSSDKPRGSVLQTREARTLCKDFAGDPTGGLAGLVMVKVRFHGMNA
jgi:hypothetical protein